MSEPHEVLKPIVNSPYDEPAQHYDIRPGEPAHLAPGRRPARYYYRPPTHNGVAPAEDAGTAVELELVNELRRRVAEWRRAGYPGVTRVTAELLRYWRQREREGARRLFFCQIEAAETIVFLVEARADMRQGLDVPRDEPSEEARARGYAGFTRYACKMATGSGKTTVMGMLTAWSILNKVCDRSDRRFSDLVLVLCPNVTIRDRLQELDPHRAEQSLYRARDLVPPDRMDDLRRGTVIVTNWHVLQPQAGNQVNGVGAAVVNKGEESDAALVRRVLGRRAGGRNVLVFNDEAHHAYRLRAVGRSDGRQGGLPEAEPELADAEAREATVWVNGLDKIGRVRGINFCVDLSATPYYLGNTGNDPGRPFPWVVSDFGLIDAIESGLVKIPQLPIEDSTGAPIPAYFNVWKWIVETKLTRAERGGARGQINPKAVLKYAHTPIAQLAGLWRERLEEWRMEPEAHPTPPVFIVVCRDTKLAKVLYDWMALGESETAPPIAEFLNKGGRENTVRVDSKVVEELESGQVKSLEARRLRFVLETIGKTRWPNDRPPEEWTETAAQLKVDPLVPPGRDVRCIISVAMLTEGWDARTVTHIVGLRPFDSQLLCEQVVGRGLRRSRYDVLDCGRVEDIPEEEAKVYGVPFEVIPYKAVGKAPAAPPGRIHHVFAVPEKAGLEIRFPRVERYTYAIRSRVRVNWDAVPLLLLDPLDIPPEVTVKGLAWTTSGRPTLHGPGRAEQVTLRAWRGQHRLQELEFDLAKTLTRAYAATPGCEVPAHALFPQLLQVVRRFVDEKVEPRSGYDRRDLFLDPFYGWTVGTLIASIQPDTARGEAPEVPVYERHRGPGSSGDVDFWTAREVFEVARSHVNAVAADTAKWEQSTAYQLDNHEHVVSFVKNAGLGFAIPYLHNAEYHEYAPDFLVRVRVDGQEVGTVILETKGYDQLAGVKKAAAERWVAAVSSDGQHGRWEYAVVYNPAHTGQVLRAAAKRLTTAAR